MTSFLSNTLRTLEKFLCKSVLLCNIHKFSCRYNLVFLEWSFPDEPMNDVTVLPVSLVRPFGSDAVIFILLATKWGDNILQGNNINLVKFLKE